MVDCPACQKQAKSVALRIAGRNHVKDVVHNPSWILKVSRSDRGFHLSMLVSNVMLQMRLNTRDVL